MEINEQLFIIFYLIDLFYTNILILAVEPDF